MKKLISLIVACAVCLSMTACGGAESGTTAADSTDRVTQLVQPEYIENQPMELNKAYPYKTNCYTDTSLDTTGHVYIYEYTVQPAGDGYVDKTVKARFVFDDDNAYNYGMSYDVVFLDLKDDDDVFTTSENWTVEMDGKEYAAEIIKDEFWGGEWTPMGSYIDDYILTMRVPEGYDDIALFFINSRNKQNVADENGNTPDGTPLTSLIDADSQWFVLGTPAEDGTLAYNGTKIETQPSDLTGWDVTGADIVRDEENEDTGDDADQPADSGDGSDDVNSTEPAGDVWIEITDSTVESVAKDVEYACANYFYKVHGHSEGLVLRYSTYNETDMNNVLDSFEFEAPDHGSLSVDIFGEKLQGDWLVVVFQLLDSDGTILSEAQMKIEIV